VRIEIDWPSAWTQLTIEVDAPGPDRAVFLSRETKFISPRSNSRYIRKPTHLHREGAVNCSAISQLPKRVGACRPDGFIGLPASVGVHHPRRSPRTFAMPVNCTGAALTAAVADPIPAFVPHTQTVPSDFKAALKFPAEMAVHNRPMSLSALVSCAQS